MSEFERIMAEDDPGELESLRRLRALEALDAHAAVSDHVHNTFDDVDAVVASYRA